MNHGTTFFAPLNVAIAISGLAAGLDPPTLGCAWHDRQLLELKRAPSPLFWPPVTDSIWTNLVSPSWKNAVSSGLSPFRPAPAPGAPARTPGSTGVCADGPGVLAHEVNTAATIPATILQTNDCLFVISVPYPLAQKECGGTIEVAAQKLPSSALFPVEPMGLAAVRTILMGSDRCQLSPTTQQIDIHRRACAWNAPIAQAVPRIAQSHRIEECR